MYGYYSQDNSDITERQQPIKLQAWHSGIELKRREGSDRVGNYSEREPLELKKFYNFLSVRGKYFIRQTKCL